MQRLLLVVLWLSAVAMGAALVWKWAWASVSGGPLVELHQSPEGWLEIADRYYAEEW